MFEREPKRVRVEGTDAVVRARAERPTVRRSPLVVGPADDPLEREADRVAAGVVRALVQPVAADPTATNDHASASGAARRTRIRRRTVGRLPTDVTPSAPTRIRRAATVGADGGALDASTDHAVRAAKTGGSPIEPRLRQRLGDAMGSDFSRVRLHSDGRADALNRSLNARAFTTGHHIFFRSGEPGVGERSHELLAHELTHVVHQQGSERTIDRKLVKKPRGTGPEAFNVIEKRAAGTPHKDQGIASKPENYKAPGFRIVVKNDKKQFTAKVVATSKANEGDNDAVFLAKGLHDSGYLWAKDEQLYGGASAATRMNPPHQAERGDDESVIFNVTGAVADGSKAAEQEHINDYRLAYDLTLGAADEAIKAVSKRRFKAGKSAQAQGAANQALLAELAARSNGHLGSVIESDWEAEYKRLFLRSGNRDMNSWHIQDVVENAALTATEAARWAYPIKVLDVQPGPQFNLTVSSQTVVDPTPVVAHTVQPVDNDENSDDT
jgi:Domain of unknown function (DUF4157)